jgi:hypothetical protein
MSFKLIQNKDIDKNKWDTAIANSMFPVSFAFSWYLNSMTEKWAAIVNNDYSIIMPLFFNSKFNKFQIFTPLLTPRLGIFYKKIPSKTQIDNLLKVIIEKANYIDLTFNKFNNINNIYTSKKYFFSLDLFYQYPVIRENYSTYLKRLLNSTNKHYIITGISPNEIISFLHKVNYFKNNKIYTDLRRILSVAILNRMANILAVFSDDNELIGIGIFILSSFTVDLLLIAAENDDEKIIAMIIDKFININAGKTITLNFDCNLSENAKKIYAEFGANQYFVHRIIFKKKTKFLNIFKKNPRKQY